ncbi:MAG: hypothetical protein JRF02_08675 [Deltaproteobacteria bacterium]|nr:hypothetical protein [Deltaproteobacteria bacterium]
MKVKLSILLITLIVSLQISTTAQAETSWFPFPYPCDTEWVEGERYYCETVHSMADLIYGEEGETLIMKARRFCRMKEGAFTATLQDGERGYLADDGDFERTLLYRLSI